MVQGRTKQASVKAALVRLQRDLRLAGQCPLTGPFSRAGTVLSVHGLDMQAAGRWRQAGGAMVPRQGGTAAIAPEPTRPAGTSEVHCGLPHRSWLHVLGIRAAAIPAPWRGRFHAPCVSTLSHRANGLQRFLADHLDDHGASLDRLNKDHPRPIAPPGKDPWRPFAGFRQQVREEARDAS